MRLRTKLIGVVLFVALAPTAVVAGTTLSIHESAYDAQRRELQLSAARTGYEHGHVLIHFDSSLVATSASE